MKNEPANLRESLWRRPPTAAEHNLLRADPNLELEARLTRALGELPDAAVPSNFTARVLAAIDREEARAERAERWHWNWRWLLPRSAIAAVLLIGGGGLFQHHEQEVRRVALARSIAQVTAAQPLPGMEALNNFDAIQRMDQVADRDLIALMQ